MSTVETIGNPRSAADERRERTREAKRRSRLKHGAKWYAWQKARRLARRKPRNLIGRKESLRRYYAKNKPKWSAWRASRLEYQLRATPAWASMEAVQAVYSLAARMSDLFGEPFEVDHVVPLSNSLVCSLHVETNLKVVPQRENRQKGNRWWPGMPT